MSEFPVTKVSKILDGILHGNDSDYDKLYQLADMDGLTPEQQHLLQLLAALVMKTEVAEYRLELMVSDLLQTQARLTASELDPLTQLPNRAVFNEQLHQHLERAQQTNSSIGLMFIDLDKFKQVNDTLGHDAGDEILQLAAKRMSRELRSEDQLSRLGGDEFTIILPSIAGYDAAESIAKRIKESLERPFSLRAGEAKIGSSIGISLFPTDANTAPALLKNADVAMYSAKESGRNRVVIYPNRHRN